MSQDAPATQTIVSRRKLLATTGAVAIGGGALTLVGGQPARAAVDMTVPKTEHVGKDGSVASVAAAVEGAYQFSAPNAEAVKLTLAVAPAGSGDWKAIDTMQKQVSRNSGAGEYALSGAVLDHGKLSAADFSADAASTTTTTVDLRVAIEVLAGGEAVVSDEATSTGTVVIENTTTATTAEMTADGEISVTL